MHEAELVFHYHSSIADAILGALAPETDGASVPKTRAAISLTHGALRIHLRADDLSALRAAINSYTRWVDAAARGAALARG